MLRHCAIILVLITACMMSGVGAQEGETPPPIPTPDWTINWYAFPYSLYCSEIDTSRSNGPNWGEIQIGSSTLSDLDIYVTGLSGGYQTDGVLGNWVNYYMSSASQADEEGVPDQIIACILEDTVWLLKVTIGDNPLLKIQLSDLITEYGLPDAVTWTEVLQTRVVFWFERGIAAEVGVYESDMETIHNFGNISNLIYFPYQNNQNYETRWPYNITRTTPPPTGDEVLVPPLPTEQNPFDFDSIIQSEQLGGRTNSEGIEPGAIMLDRVGIPMVYVPPATYVVGIDPVRLRELCDARGEADADRCVEIIEEDTGATYTYNVDLPAFWIDQYEVTIEQFSQVCTANYIWFPEGCVDRQLPPEVTNLPNQPQLGVTYMDAIAYCGSRGARLPTEAEWEYAASGPDKLLFPWGNEFNPDYVNPFDEYPPQRTYPVGSISENQSWIGVFDMAGNAAEWVEDRFLPRFLMMLSLEEVYISNKGVDADIRRVIRGGSWDGRPWPMTTFYREAETPQTLSWWVGFRCARTTPPGE